MNPAKRSCRKRACSIRHAARPAPCGPRSSPTTTAISRIPTCCRLWLTQEYVDAIAADLPELPDDKKARFIADFGLTPYDAGVLVASRRTAEYFETRGPRAAMPRWQPTG